MSPTPTVRRAVPADAEAFSACHLACWREAFADLWDAERFEGLDLGRMASRRRKEIEAGIADHYLVEGDGSDDDDPAGNGATKVIGIAIAGPSRDEDAPTERELYAIYIREAPQGSGLADDLLEAAIDAHPATLWVYRDNPRASAFYVHHDFIPDGEERVDSEGILEIRMVRR
jgi:GNAT superfamily N-acetyltransferase